MSSGVHSLDLTGYHDTPPHAGVKPTISTVAGRTYRLSLALGNNSAYSGRNAVVVRAGPAGALFAMTPGGAPGNQ